MSTVIKKGTKPIVVRKMPVVLNSNYKVVKNKLVSDSEIQNLLYKDDIIYEGNGDFLKEKHTKIVIINRSHRLNHTSRTFVKYYSKDICVEKTSDNVKNLIGQDNYDTLLSALCSVWSQELRLKGILALLTIFKQAVDASSQTDLHTRTGNTYSNASTQTGDHKESPFAIKVKRMRQRRLPKPYIIKPVQTKGRPCIVNTRSLNPGFINNTNLEMIKVESTDQHNNKQDIDIKSEPAVNTMAVQEEFTVPIIGSKHSKLYIENLITYEENSNESFSNLSLSSVTTNNSAFNDLSFSLIDKVDQHTQQVHEGYILKIKDHSIILRSKPEDEFHIATKENLMYLNPADQKKLLWYQAELDLKNCLYKDEDGHLPLHIAVLNNDVEMLTRQCAMLRIRKEDVDIPMHGNYTALKMAIIKDYPECMSVLLRMGADPLYVDDDHKTALHHAAEGSQEAVQVLLKYCADNARKILQENDNLWKPNYGGESDEKLAQYLHEYLVSCWDSQGYNPMMLACQLGKVENVKMLVNSCPNAVNNKMPTSGNTALYLTIVAACADALARGNKSKLANKYKECMEILLNNGADPGIENYVGTNVTLLLHELNLFELSSLVASKTILTTYAQNDTLIANYDSVMLLKNDSGNVNLAPLYKEKNSLKQAYVKAVDAKSVSQTIDNEVEKASNVNSQIIDNVENIECDSNVVVKTEFEDANVTPLNLETKSFQSMFVKTVDSKSVNSSIDKSGIETGINIMNPRTVDNFEGNVTKSNVQNSKLKVIANIKVNIDNNLIEKLAKTGHIVNVIDKNVDIKNLNKIGLSNKMSPVKIENKEIHIPNTTDNTNTKAPISNMTIKPNSNVQMGINKIQPIIQISNAKVPSNTKNILRLNDVTGGSAKISVLIPSRSHPIEKNTNCDKKRKMQVVVKDNAKVRKVE